MFDWQLGLFELAVFASVSGAALAVLCWWLRDRRVDRRLDELGPEAATGIAHPSNGSRLGKFLERLCLRGQPSQAVGAEFTRSRLQNRLLAAGIRTPAAPYVFAVARAALTVVPALCGLAAGLTGALDVTRGLLLGALTGALGLVLPGLWLDRRKARRQIILNRSLPDFLDLLVTCVESGLSLDAALRRVTAELRVAHPLLAGEMERVQAEIDLGSTAEAALQNLADRCDLESIATLSAFVLQARRFGTSIADALRSHADMLRFHREQRAEELAQKAAVKILFPTLLCIFPAVFIVLAGPAAIQVSEKFISQPESARAVH